MTITFDQLQALINNFGLVVDNSQYESKKIQHIRGVVEGRRLTICVFYGTKKVYFHEAVSNSEVVKELV